MAADAMVFLISPHSVDDNSYTLTELKFARQKWAHPKARLLPVMVGKTDWDRIPSYLKAVTVLTPAGNVAAEVIAAVSSLSLERTGLALPSQRYLKMRLSILVIRLHFE